MPRATRRARDTASLVRLLVVLVFIVVDRLDLDLDRLGAGLDQDEPGVGVPAERQRRRPEGLDERLVEGSGVGRLRRRPQPR